MTKKELEAIILKSYTNNVLDETAAVAITNNLSRNDLKEYIKALKQYEKKRTVVITMALPTDEKTKKEFEELFPDKQLDYEIDKELLLGVRIANDDLIYELSLKNAFDELVEHASQIHD